MFERVVGMLCGLWAYLRACLFERVGPLWWGVALVAGIVAYAACSAYARRAGTERRRALPCGLLVAYVTLLVAATVLCRDVGGEHWQGFLAAGGLAGAVHGLVVGSDAVANALMLAPVGALLPAVTGWGLPRTALSCLAFSSWVELVQLVCAVGWPDPSDVALNVLGGVVGYGMRSLVVAARDRLRLV